MGNEEIIEFCKKHNIPVEYARNYMNENWQCLGIASEMNVLKFIFDSYYPELFVDEIKQHKKVGSEMDKLKKGIRSIAKDFNRSVEEIENMFNTKYESYDGLITTETLLNTIRAELENQSVPGNGRTNIKIEMKPETVRPSSSVASIDAKIKLDMKPPKITIKKEEEKKISLNISIKPTKKEEKNHKSHTVLSEKYQIAEPENETVSEESAAESEQSTQEQPTQKQPTQEQPTGESIKEELPKPMNAIVLSTKPPVTRIKSTIEESIEEFEKEERKQEDELRKMGKTEQESAIVQTQTRFLSSKYFNFEAYLAMKEMAKDFIRSNALPPSIENFPQMLMVLQSGYEKGLKPMQSLNGLYIVKGVVTVWGPVTIALLRRAGYDIIFEVSTDKEALVKIVAPDGKFRTERFTIEQAQRARLTEKDVWKRYPDIMMRWKALGRCARFFCQDVLEGMYVTEEMDDFGEDDMKHQPGGFS